MPTNDPYCRIQDRGWARGRAQDERLEGDIAKPAPNPRPFVSSPSACCLAAALRINFGLQAEVETHARGISTANQRAAVHPEPAEGLDANGVGGFGDSPLRQPVRLPGSPRSRSLVCLPPAPNGSHTSCARKTPNGPAPLPPTLTGLPRRPVRQANLANWGRACRGCRA